MNTKLIYSDVFSASLFHQAFSLFFNSESFLGVCFNPSIQYLEFFQIQLLNCSLLKEEFSLIH